MIALKRRRHHRCRLSGMSAWDPRGAARSANGFIVDHIPSRQVTLVSGVGGIGKSVLTLRLPGIDRTCGVNGVGGLFPKPGAAICLGAEGEQDEIHRRLAAILEHYDARFCRVTVSGPDFRRAGLCAEQGRRARPGVRSRNGRIQSHQTYSVRSTPRAVEAPAQGASRDRHRVGRISRRRDQAARSGPAVWLQS